MMSPQILIDGVLDGALIGLGAIGVTLTYSILRFANFAHGEMLTAGAYATLVFSGWLAGAAPHAPIGDLSFGTTQIAATLLAMAAVGGLALLLDRLLFRRLRARGASIAVVMASFGASMALRALIETIFTSRPAYLSQDLQIAVRLGGGMRATPDQMAMVGLAASLMIAVHLLLTRTRIGRAMRAVSENATLARVAGVDVDAVVQLTWLLGGALAAAAGTMLGLLVQIRPEMGFDLLLPMFAAAILGGIGSVPGAMVGALVLGLGEAATVALVGPEWRAGLAFVLLIAILLVRPQGLFGARA